MKALHDVGPSRPRTPGDQSGPGRSQPATVPGHVSRRTGLPRLLAILLADRRHRSHAGPEDDRAGQG